MQVNKSIKLKDRNQKIVSTNAEKTFDDAQH